MSTIDTDWTAALDQLQLQIPYSYNEYLIKKHNKINTNASEV
jgi:hypothetical protein